MIDRKKVLSGLECHRNGFCSFCPYDDGSILTTFCKRQLLEDVIELLKEQPEQKHGHWIPIKLPSGVEAFGYKEYTVQEVICSECGLTEDVMALSYSYCPHCGTKMDEGVNQNETD